MSVKIVHPSKDNLPHLPTGGAPTKSIPLFSMADLDDEEGEDELVLDHEEDLFPSIRECKIMAEMKATWEAQEVEDALTLCSQSTEQTPLPTSEDAAVSSNPKPIDHTTSRDTSHPPEPIPSLESYVTNTMETDPEDDVLDYGMSDDKTPPSPPVKTEASTTEIPIITQNTILATSSKKGGISELNKETSLTSKFLDPVSDQITR
ncbi:hypothetical protein DXG01_004489 [Tephrocybe rancida]|nr:hypothetical protein DXG01_004489 [Tephrocybe rancida]